MSKWDEAAIDALLAYLLRFGLCAGIVAILALITACSPFPTAKDVLPSMSGGALSFRADQENQTRSQIPQRGCDEKSDSSLTKPLL